MEGRRTSDRWGVERAPRPLHDEVVRHRLIDRLAARWNVSVVLLEAAGGFGKSVALGQAMRDNESDPSGVDVYLACRRADADAQHFTRRLLSRLDPAAVSAVEDAEDLADLVATHLALASPTRVALILDDLHHLRPNDSTTALLGRLVRHLPTNGRLVLAGRELPTLPLARLVAADEVIRVDQRELAFTTDEVAVLAATHQADPRRLRSAAGWPALTRLAITVGSVASIEYLLEEVVDGLDPALRRAIAVAVLAKRIDAPSLCRIAGLDSMQPLANKVPLLIRHDDGAIGAHDLWADVLADLVSADERRRLAGEVARWHAGFHRFDEAIEVATANGAWDDALDAVIGFIAGGDGFPSARRVEMWMGRFPEELRDAPELCLLRGLAARIAHEPGAGMADVERALATFLEGSDVGRISAAGFEVGYGAWLRGDLGRVLDMYQLALRLREDGHTQMDPLIHIVQAVMADLQGDAAAARNHLDAVDVATIPVPLVTFVLREHVALSLLMGDSKRAVEVVATMRSWTPNARVEFIVAMTFWFDGDPEPVLERWALLRHATTDHSQDDFLSCVYSTIIDASLGLVGDRAGLQRFATQRSREKTFRALATTAALVAEGAHEAAEATMEALLDEVGLDDSLCLGELRRCLPLGYVLSARIRDRLDHETLGPKHEEWRLIARMYVDASEGREVAWSTMAAPSEILCALPLRWSARLAALATAAGSPKGAQLAAYLGTKTDGRADALLEALTSESGPVGAGAAQLVRATPRPPAAPVQVIGCGPMRVVARFTADESILRRSRVREMLGLLLLRDRVSVDRCASALWPELAPTPARNNLRITLTFLRRLLEPERPAGSPSFHLCRDATHLWLRRSPLLCSDVWDIQAHLAQSREQARVGDVPGSIAAVREAVARWTGELLPDLRYNDLATSELTHLELALADGAAQVAEWSLAHGELDEAMVLATRLLAHDPYNERGHAALVSALQLAGRLDDARAAARRCVDALAELRVLPSDTTAMVLKRADVAVPVRGSVEVS